MSDAVLFMTAYCSLVLAVVAYFASNVGAERRGYRRHKGWFAVAILWFLVALAAVVALIARNVQ